MYTFSPVTERILKMREQIRERVVHNDAERARLLTEAYKKYEDVLPIIKRPLSVKYVIERMSFYVGDEELIVGGKGGHIFSACQYPEMMNSDWILHGVESGEWTIREDGLYHNPDNEELKHEISPEDYQFLRDTREFWENHRLARAADAWQPDGFDELQRLNVSSYVKGGMSITALPAGHLIAGHKRIIETGYRTIRLQAQAWLDEHAGVFMGEDLEKMMFYKSVVITCEAAEIMCRRYAKAVRAKAASCKDEKRLSELERIANNLEWIAENPARDFWEACQAYECYQMFVYMFSRMPALALGRFDQITWPYLKRDLEAGTITTEFAQELIDSFFLKVGCFYGPGPAKLVDTTGIGNTYQHTTLGGVDPKTGEDATNPITYMVLETVGRLKLHDPTISLRFNKNSPDRLWECAIATSGLVGGLPLYQNDEVIIPALVKFGYSLEDARDYGFIGCQEIVGSGNDYPAPNGNPPHASVWWAAILDMAINNGVNPFNGEACSVKTGYLYEMSSIDEVREAVRKIGTHIMKLFVTANNYAEFIHSRYSPEAELSISIEGCMESGRDVVNGGAKYNSYGGTATGLATVADSLTAIKYMCFDQKLCTTREMYDAVMANWVGYEQLQSYIINNVPHYGNADPYADEELKWCVELYHDICSQCHSTRSRVYKSGLYGASDHIAQGRINWATPDGRKTGEPIADAMSPAQGRDHNGPLAVFRSTCCFDHHDFLGGIALNIRMHPTVISRDDGAEKLRDATKSYFSSGGMEVQYNIVDSETLRAAQREPEKYRDLVVRIAGYSAYFVELGRDLQNDIIARNENII